MKIALLLLAIAAVGLLALIAAVVQPVPGSGPRWGGPAADPDRLARLVRGLIGLGPRHDAAGQWKAADFVRAQLGGFAVEEQRYTVAGAGFRNLIVRLGPDTQERLVIGAHYDAHGPYPGADDNASGTAALIEIARLLQGATLPLRTELAWYSNEEYGLLGSEAHARSVRGVRAMVSLEMLGCFNQPQRFPFAALRLLYPSHGDYIMVVGRFRDIPVVGSIKSALKANGAAARSINAIAMVPGIDASDHASFWGQGVKAAMVTDTAWYRNPRYHTARDTPDTLDYARMARIVEGMAAWASAVPR
ncbi:MAG TPA: M28 family peptidase [Myxococcales bacterium]|nr:M28 family peptidase [Myxococcales bacterium]